MTAASASPGLVIHHGSSTVATAERVGTMATATALGRLTDDEPIHFADCCAGISWPLLETLATHMPQNPALILSVGCGSGLLESMLLLATNGEVNVFGVEVPGCINKHLPEDRLLRVPCTASLHPDAMLASALMFVYPRQPDLVASYVNGFLDGAVEQVLWLGHRNDWPEIDLILRPAFGKLEFIEGHRLPAYELLVVASLPRSLQR